MNDTVATTGNAGKKQVPQIETVTMSDQRIVEFPGKRRLQKASNILPDGQVQVRLDFRNGETRLFTIPPAMLAKFAAHGAEQKLGDEIAGVEDTDDAVLAIDELIDRLYSGEWGITRDASGMAGTSALLRALVEQTGKSVEVIKAFLKNKTQAEKVALRSNPKIKPIVERLEAEKAAKKAANGQSVDTEKMLGELEAA
jgi:hypothetical protein